MKMNSLYLIHHGIKGQKWGVRRYQNKDGSLTSEGIKKYRKDYDDIKSYQRMNDNFKSDYDKYGKFMSKIGNYSLNSSYGYETKAKQRYVTLLRKIGDVGISQIDKQVVNEGKAAAQKAFKKAEKFNSQLNLDIEGNKLFLLDPQKVADHTKQEYFKKNRMERYSNATGNFISFKKMNRIRHK